MRFPDDGLRSRWPRPRSFAAPLAARLAVERHPHPGARRGLWAVAALLLGSVGCPPSEPRPRPTPPRAVRPPPRRASPPPLSLPADATKRYLQATAALPLPAGQLLAHLQLDRLPDRGPATRRSLPRAVWSGLRVDSVAAGQLWPYVRGCGVRPLRDPRAVTLAQPPTGEPDTERVVILWGLVMAQRQVRCLRGAMERHGASTVTRYAGGEPAFGADRAVSGLHLEVAALDDSTLLVAAGRRYRRWWRRFLAAGGASAAGARLYRVAVGQAPAGSALLFVVPRFPAPLPHLPVPPSVPRSFRGACLWVRPHDSGLRIESWVRVAGQGRAARWARKLPRRAARLARLLPAPQRPFLTRVGGRARGQALRLRLDVPPRRLPAFGRFVRRWLPW